MYLQKVINKKIDILKVTEEKSRIWIRIRIRKSVVWYGKKHYMGSSICKKTLSPAPEGFNPDKQSACVISMLVSPIGCVARGGSFK